MPNAIAHCNFLLGFCSLFFSPEQCLITSGPAPLWIPVFDFCPAISMHLSVALPFFS
jgi:hypothetical protein